MAAESLRCRECSAVYPLDAHYVCERCFGPLEVAYGPRWMGGARETPAVYLLRDARGGPQQHAIAACLVDVS